jgi:ribosomal protein S18 acetylase RimI-like enzyme
MKTDPEIKFSPMTIKDYDAVYALWKSLPGIGLSSADTREVIEQYLVRNAGLSFVARDGNKLIGAVLCGHDGRRGYLNHLAVDPGYRHRGIGHRLADTCLQALKAAGIHKCHIFVYADNANGLPFWETGGWHDRPELVLMSHDID